MYISAISFIFIAAAILAAAIIRRRTVSRRSADTPPAATEPGIPLLPAVIQCRLTIGSALECVAGGDVVAACRNDRLGSARLHAMRREVAKCGDSSQAACYRYMLEAAQRIAELSRHIITDPDNHVAPSCRCDIVAIGRGLDRMLQSAELILSSGCGSGRLKEESAGLKDFTGRVIDVYSGEITRKEAGDGPAAYSCLMLLCYIHTFISSFSRLLPITESSGYTTDLTA